MPRATRNPVMSLWLSLANRVAVAGRGIATAAARRQQAAATRAMAQGATDAWTRLLGGKTRPPRGKQR